MEGVEQAVRYGISQDDLLEVVKVQEGRILDTEDKFDIEAYEKKRDEILSADKVVQSYEGSGVIIGGCLFRVDLKSGIYNIGIRIVKHKSPTFNAEPGDSVIDIISAHPLHRLYSDAQRKQILAWRGDDFRRIAERKGLRYFNECSLLTENLENVSYENMKERLSRSLYDIIAATGEIQELAKRYAQHQEVYF